MNLHISPVDSNDDYMKIREDVYITASSRILRKVDKNPHNSYYIGSLRSPMFCVYAEIDTFDALHILKLARDEVRKEIKTEQRWEEHKKLEQEFATLSLEEKQRLLSHD